MTLRSGSYSMSNEDVSKREEKETLKTGDPQLLGFKRISTDVDSEAYEIGTLSPANERASYLALYTNILSTALQR